jgi:hypothetical protein
VSSLCVRESPRRQPKAHKRFVSSLMNQRNRLSWAGR